MKHPRVIFEEYLLTLDDKTEEEYYSTERALAKVNIEGYVDFCERASKLDKATK